MSNVYHEFPTDKIVAIHWSGTPVPTCKESPPGPALCGNKYGWGGLMVDEGGGLISSDPYGPDQFAPFVGTWNTHANNGPVAPNGDGLYGGLLHPYVDAEGNQITDTITADDYGLHAQELRITDTALTFTNSQLQTLEDAHGNLAWEYWTVPMAEGQYCRNLNAGRAGQPPTWQLVPVVVKNIEFHLSWSVASHDERDLLGVAIAHALLPDGGSGVLAPSEPTYLLGSAKEGDAFFKYDFKWKTWSDAVLRANLLGHPIVYDASNNFDPSTGGPVYFLWLEQRYPRTDWETFGGLFAPFNPGEGDWYIWEAIATCVATSDAE